jgi:diguanylate cyclase (GGDEF)-like protein
VREQLSHTWKYFPKEHITVTVGVATFPSDGGDMKNLIRNADKALYTGKKEGKDRTVLYIK